ncbi:MAG: AIR synthase related protein [Bdellovibrionota bacterium]
MRLGSKKWTGLDDIVENRFLNRWETLLSRHPSQVNGLHEADAELLAIDEQTLLASTIDTISEEISSGLYSTPETIGWVAAMASLSDLAAVGAAPLGLLSAVTLPMSASDEFADGIGRGLEGACRRIQTYMLGGDTNRAHCASVTVCAIGTLKADLQLTRVGAKQGDLVFSTGLLGQGAGMAARVLLARDGGRTADCDFRPVARIREAALARPFTTACMDTSDGLIATLDQLSRLNGARIDISAQPASLLCAETKAVSEAMKLPPLTLLSGHHGEFELVFIVLAAKSDEFIRTMQNSGCNPILIGRIETGTGVSVSGRDLPTAKIRNLYEENKGDLQKYVKELIALTVLNQT